MKKLLLLFLVVSSPCWAIKEYYSLSKSLRALGMGGAYYALSDDEYALFYNPAGLSLYRGEGQLMFSFQAQSASDTLNALQTLSTLSGSSTTQLAEKLTPLQGEDLYAGFSVFPYYLRKHFAVGLLLADTKVNLGLIGNNLDSSIDATVISDSGLLIGYGRQLFDNNLHIGLTTKALIRAGGREDLSILDLVQGTNLNLSPQQLGGVGFGIDFDLGAIYDLPEPAFGLSNRLSLTISNVLASNFTLAVIEGSNIPQLPRSFTLGSSAVLGGWEFINNFTLALDFAEFGFGGQSDPDLGARVGSFWKHVNLGVEMPMGKGWFKLRGGIHQGDFTAGLEVNLRYVKLELATYTEQLEEGVDRLNSRRFAMRLSFGGGDIPAPITSRTDRDRLPVVIESRPERGPSSIEEPSELYDLGPAPKVEEPAPAEKVQPPPVKNEGTPESQNGQ